MINILKWLTLDYAKAAQQYQILKDYLGHHHQNTLSFYLLIQIDTQYGIDAGDIPGPRIWAVGHAIGIKADIAMITSPHQKPMLNIKVLPTAP